jgi:Protein of unknown function (DUF2934)
MPGKKRNSVRSIAVRQVTERDIAERAYSRWLSRGCPVSDGLEDWFAAQEELQHELGMHMPSRAKTALRSV